MGARNLWCFLPETSAQGAYAVATNIYRAIDRQMIQHEKSLVSNHVTISLGITVFNGNPKISQDSVIHTADKALYIERNNLDVIRFTINHFPVLSKEYKNRIPQVSGFFIKQSKLFENLTVTPERTFPPRSFASQLVKRIQPCDAVLEINDGFGVP